MNTKPMEITDETLKTVSGGRHEEQEIIAAKKLKEKLDGKTVRVTLVLSVSSKEISDAIDEQFDIRIDKRSIETPEIRTPGTYSIKVNIASGIVAKMSVLAT